MSERSEPDNRIESTNNSYHFTFCLEEPISLKKVKYNHDINLPSPITEIFDCEFNNMLQQYAITPSGKKPKKFSKKNPNTHPLLIGRKNINVDIFSPIIDTNLVSYAEQEFNNVNKTSIHSKDESYYLTVEENNSEKEVDTYMLSLMIEYPELNFIDTSEDDTNIQVDTSNIQVDTSNIQVEDDCDISMSTLIQKYTVEYDYANAIECALSDIGNETMHIKNIFGYYMKCNDNNSVKICLTIASEKNNIYAMYELVYFYTYVQRNMCLAVNYCMKVLSSTDNHKYITDMCAILIDYYRVIDSASEYTYMLMAVKYGDYQYIKKILLLYRKNNETEKFMNLYQEHYSNIHVRFKNELEYTLEHLINYHCKLKIKNFIFISLFKMCYSFDSILIKRNFVYALEIMYSKKSPIPRESMIELFEYIDPTICSAITPTFKSLIISVQLNLNNIPKDDNYNKAKTELLKKLI